MKNISRRVFIKGMAVAAAATAASTVLAGCNLSQNVEGEVENNTPASSVLTLPEDKGTITVSSLGFVKGNEVYGTKEATAKLKFDTDLVSGTTVKFYDADADATTNNEYYVLTSAYYDGNKNLSVSSSDIEDAGVFASSTPFSVTGEAVTLSTAAFKNLDNKAHSTITVKFELKQYVAQNSSAEKAYRSIKAVEFTYNL